MEHKCWSTCSMTTTNTIDLFITFVPTAGPQSSSSSMATPKTSPEHPTVTAAGVKGRDTTGGVVGVIVVIVVVVIVVVVVAILVAYFSIRRKANQQNPQCWYTEEPL
ncbi:hypothetical protein GBAR_LOCUS10378 [Geodia barretti]|uniref:Uncharacterized protein n=1 Tax=Geodia barretti TaxID=519541 RepID=A0AA35RSQ0_GEOBA|nr:hypothetical protein GBAR_LOCUS10378 [Geodia barretti]